MLHGRVHPYPRPLSVRQNGKHVKQTPQMVGGKSGTEPLSVGLVIVSRYKPGARWRPRKLSAGEGALALIEKHRISSGVPETVLETLRRAMTNAPVLKGVHGEPCK